MRRGLTPGGRVVVTTPPPNAFFDALDEAITRYVGSDAGAFVRMVFVAQRSGDHRMTCFIMPGLLT